jgi:F0F1-type ATP synthase membrane subunit b/b'
MPSCFIADAAMPDNEDVLLDDEIRRLRKARDLWRAIALAALVLVFMALIPFTIAFWRVIEVRRQRIDATMQETRYLRDKALELEKQLQEKAKADGK